MAFPFIFNHWPISCKRFVTSSSMIPSGVGPTPNNKQPPLAMIPIKILIIFCGDLKGALGVHPQSLLSGGQLSQG